MSESLKPASLAALKKAREIVAVGPSGNAYKIRPLNMERYALSGTLPTSLRQLAAGGAAAIDKVFGDDGAITEHGEEVRGYLDGLVRQVIVEPALHDVDLDVLPPVDYRWAVQVALGEEDRDGEGRRLWGREPLTIWATFRKEHGCDEDCPCCDRLQRSVAADQ